MTKENLVEVIPTSGGLAVFQVLAPEDILGLEAGDLAKTAVVHPEEVAALEKALEVIRYLSEAQVNPADLFFGD